MICPSCGVQQQDAPECLFCHVPIGRKGGEEDISLEPIVVPADLSPEAIAGAEEPEIAAAPDPADPVKEELENQARIIREQEKQIQAQLQKMEEEKQRLQEIKLNHEKQLQEMKALEEQKRAEQKASEIAQAADKFKNILITSLPSIEGRPIAEYKGLVGAQVLIKTDGLEKQIAALKDAAGLRNTPYYENLKKGFQIGLSDLKIEASKLQANAVLNVDVKEKYLTDQVLVLSFTGTAVVCQNENEKKKSG